MTTEVSYVEQLSLRLELAIDEAFQDRETIRQLWCALRRSGWLTPDVKALVRDTEAKLRGWGMVQPMGEEWVDREAAP